MRYTQYRGLAQVTNWVKLKFVAMNLKKWPHGNGGICCPRFALLFFRSYMFETQSAHDYRLPICPIVYWTDRRMKFLDFSRLFLYNIKCKIVVFCLYLEKVLPLPLEFLQNRCAVARPGGTFFVPRRGRTERRRFGVMIWLICGWATCWYPPA